jgi:hypothetical protein
MDVAYYLSELLSQLGEVNVPGLGYFTLVKVDGYYNNNEAKFYPPGSKISFDTNFIDDDILTQYIADKKKISLASSKYFTTKYIDNLKLEALHKDVALANLGWLHFVNTQLSFKASDGLSVNAAFYGYPEIAINKLETKSIYEQIDDELAAPAYVPVPPLPEPEPEIPIGAPPIKVEPVEQPETFTPEEEIFVREEVVITPQPEYVAPKQTHNEEEFIFPGRTYVEEKEGKNYDWLWISLIIIFIVGIIGVFALYKFNPDEYNKLRGITPAPVKLKTPVKDDTLKTVSPALKADSAKDTTKKVVADTTVKTAVAVHNQPASTIDSTKIRWEVIGASTQTLVAANKVVENYNSLKIPAHVLNSIPGKRMFKVSLGTYATKPEAIEAINYLINTGKVKDNIWPLKINPK